MRYIVIILLFIMVVFSTSTLANENNNSYFTTVEGKLLISGHEPLTNLSLKINQSAGYSISGEYVRELKNLSGATVRITGLVKDSKMPRTLGDMEAIRYSIVSPKDNLKSEWAVGVIYYSQLGYVLVGENQVIYNLVNLEELGLEEYEKSKIVLFGEIDYYNDFYADFSIEGYNVLNDYE